MAENPLLPNAKLKEMYALMKRARRLSKAPATAPRFEAILSATLMHVEAGDFVSPPPDVAVLAALAAERTQGSKGGAALAVTPFPAPTRLTNVAGVAHGLRLAGSDRIAVYYTDAGPASARTEPDWVHVLTAATRLELPLLFVCAEVGGSTPSSNAKAITWNSMSKLAKKLKLPVLPVDGTDAVALYRVMQESTVRARHLGGVAVLWCTLPAALQRTAANDPIAVLHQYLKVRKISLTR